MCGSVTKQCPVILAGGYREVTDQQGRLSRSLQRITPAIMQPLTGPVDHRV